MTTPSPLLLLGALGAVSAAAASFAGPVDTSAWKCAACPFENGTSGAVDLGVGNVRQQSTRYSDYTGLEQGTHLIVGGEVRWRNEGGVFGSVRATDLGLDTRALAAQLGEEGTFTLRLAYDELPRYFADGAQTPFLGNGGTVLTLPSGYPANNTAAMPLAATLQPLALGYKRSRLDAGATWTAGENWTYRIDARHVARNGTRPTAGSFFSTASQFAAPIDQVTDELEAVVSYASREMQARLSLHTSKFRNAQETVTWSNPFSPVFAGADTGQIALAPDNQFNQVAASAGYELSPQWRLSADAAYGRMRQDAVFLEPTLNPNLAASVPPLAAQSLQVLVNVFNGGVKLTAAPLDGLRINASVARNARENRTPVQSVPAVSTDMFLGATPRTNTPYSFWQDRVKLVADYRAGSRLQVSAGAEQDKRERSYQEVVTTRETTLWGAASGQPVEAVSLSLKLSRAERDGSAYGVATWVDSPQNPLLRKYELADRQRNAARLRADWTATEKLAIGFGVDVTRDDYQRSTIGLTSGRSFSLSGDLSYAFTEKTQLRLYAQGETIRSQQAGSQTYTTPDWTARLEDSFNVVGLGVKHLALADKLELGADVAITRSRSNIDVDTGVLAPAFPTATTAFDSLKLHANYRLKDDLSLIGSYWYERYTGVDWRLDGVQPDTLPDLLAFGEQAPRYHVSVFRLALRYRF